VATEVTDGCACGHSLHSHTVTWGRGPHSPGQDRDRGCDVPRCICPWYRDRNREEQL
jgi:hypothetical protein